MPTAVERAISVHRERWGEPDLVVRAPGRVNLIGEHTDYNDGFTMPMALPFDTVISMSNAGDPHDGTVTVVSEGFGECSFEPTDSATAGSGWSVHLRGVVELLGAEGIAAGGWRAAIASDIPIGASLSSSAALEVAAIMALLARAQVSWTPIEIAQLGQRVENEIVGLPSGIMDQFISAGAVEGHASVMDCRALTLTPTRLPPDAVIVVMDTGTRRVLAEVAYGDRRASCARAAAALGVPALRDATLADLVRIDDPVDRRRAKHVIEENSRVWEAAAAAGRGDVAGLGALMSASHVSLRDDFEVSGPSLDRIVELAQDAPGCLGARMTGGGFAGCAVALVRRDEVGDFTEAIIERYDFEGRTARVWLCTPGAGASVIS